MRRDAPPEPQYPGAVPLPFAFVVGFLLGALLASVASPELARDEAPLALSRPFAVTVAFALLVFVPVAGYFVAFHGDWAYLYLVRWRGMPSAVDLALVLVAGAAVVGGFVAAAPFARRRRTGPMAALVVVPGVVALAMVSISLHRLALSASYAQFHGDFGTEPIAESPLGKGVLVMDAALALAVAWSVRAMLAMAAEAKK
jgi:hypothetical protein